MSVLGKLSLNVYTVTPKMVTIVASEKQSNAAIAPLINKLDDFLHQATASLRSLPPSTKRQTIDVSDVQIREADILTNIVTALVSVDPTQVPSFQTMVQTLDGIMADEINQFGINIGTLNFTTKLMLEKEPSLQQLQMNQTLTALLLT